MYFLHNSFRHYLEKKIHKKNLLLSLAAFGLGPYGDWEGAEKVLLDE